MKKALVMGAGNIGRGVIGYILAKAGYKLEFFDIAIDKMHEIENQKGYSIFISGDTIERFDVDHFRAVPLDGLEKSIEDQDLIFCSVYEGAFPSIAESVANVLKKNKEKQKNKNIMLCVNSLHAPEKFTSLVKTNLADDQTALDYFEQKVGINQVMVLSAGLPVPEELAKEHPNAVMITKNPHLEIDGVSFKGEEPVIEDVAYVNNAEGRIFRKVYVGNMRHTMAAFMGKVKHLDFVYQAQKDPFIRPCIIAAFDEAHDAITKRYVFDEKEDEEWVTYMNDKLNQEVKDPVDRVIANPELKLSDGERFIGIAKLCLEEQVLPYHIALGVAYGLQFLISQQTIANIDDGLRNICGLDPDKDYVLYYLVKDHYNLIKNLGE